MISPARVAAYQVLTAISAGDADLPTALASARSRLGDDRDRGLAADIAAGVQRWRGALDHLIVVFSKRRIDRLDPEIVEILRLSAYQLLHHSRVPASAVVDDGVELARRAGKRSASGFVNAVLRTIPRSRDKLPLPGPPVDPADRAASLDYLSITLSHPRWLAERWHDRLGFQAAEAWMMFNNQPAPLTLRANRLKMDRVRLTAELQKEDVRVSPARFAPDGLVVEGGFPLRGHGLDAGWFVVQDEASQLVALLAGSAPGCRVLDSCASPGGKTTALAAAMGNLGLLVACDVRPRRMALLKRTVAASGATNVRLLQADLLAPLPFGERFDCVLVDAPCSGLGTLRRDPDIRWRRREEELATLAARQLVMLRHAAAAVRDGGRLIYATCSSEPEENEQVADRFLADLPDFIERRCPDLVPRSVLDERGRLRTSPHLHSLEAFFGVVFERRTSLPAGSAGDEAQRTKNL